MIPTFNYHASSRKLAADDVTVETYYGAFWLEKAHSRFGDDLNRLTLTYDLGCESPASYGRDPYTHTR